MPFYNTILRESACALISPTVKLELNFEHHLLHVAVIEIREKDSAAFMKASDYRYAYNNCFWRGICEFLIKREEKLKILLKKPHPVQNKSVASTEQQNPTTVKTCTKWDFGFISVSKDFQFSSKIMHKAMSLNVMCFT